MKVLEFKTKSKKSAVIVVDIQNDFCNPKGLLFVPDSRNTIELIENLPEKAMFTIEIRKL